MASFWSVSNVCVGADARSLSFRSWYDLFDLLSSIPPFDLRVDAPAPPRRRPRTPRPTRDRNGDAEVLLCSKCCMEERECAEFKDANVVDAETEMEDKLLSLELRDVGETDLDLDNGE